MLDYQDILNASAEKAKGVIDDPSKVKELLAGLEQKLRQFPAIGESISDLPVLVAMVKSWINKEYAVSPKVLAIIVGALLYLVRQKDVIPDYIPILGLADDIAILLLAMKLIHPDLQQYREWKALH